MRAVEHEYPERRLTAKHIANDLDAQAAATHSEQRNVLESRIAAFFRECVKLANFLRERCRRFEPTETILDRLSCSRIALFPEIGIVLPNGFREMPVRCIR